MSDDYPPRKKRTLTQFEKDAISQRIIKQSEHKREEEARKASIAEKKQKAAEEKAKADEDQFKLF